MIDHNIHPHMLYRLVSALVLAAVLAAFGLAQGCSTITWDAGRGAAHVTCRDTESVVVLPGGQTLTITHERGRGLCDAVEALHGARP